MKADLPSRRATSASLEVIVLLAAAALLAAFTAMRYGGLWGEVDTSNTAQFIRSMYETGELVPARNAYPNGYAYQTLAVLLMNISGLSLPTLQLFGAALLAVWVVWPAWLVYREFTGTARAATLATVILLAQPEFLFGIMRGTHEKFTRGLMLLCLFLLLRSLRSRNKPAHFTALVIAFYLAVYGVISFNNMIAVSFILAILLAVALLGALSFARRRTTGHSQLPVRRLTLVLVTSLVLGFLFTFFLYLPAQHDVQVLATMADRLAALFLDVETASTNPYERWVAGAWVSTPVYFIMAMANWVLLLASALIWLWQTATWFVKRQWPEDERTVLLWAFYGAFAFMGAVSILIDISGALSANLQHRSFPSFAILAAPVVAVWLVEHLPSRPSRARWSYAALGALITVLAILSTLKATNEPLFSNKWTYYAPAEFTALDWSRGKNPDAPIWTEFDERLTAAIGICCNWRAEGTRLDSYVPDPNTRNFLISDVVRARGQRLGLPLPIAGDSLGVYDNGQAQIYRLRPRTPYQR